MSRSVLIFLLSTGCRLKGDTGDRGGDTDGGGDTDRGEDTDGGENTDGGGDMGQLNTRFSGSARLLLWTQVVLKQSSRSRDLHLYLNSVTSLCLNLRSECCFINRRRRLNRDFKVLFGVPLRCFSCL